MLVLTTHQAVISREAIRDTWASVTKNNTANVRHVGRSSVEHFMRSVEKEHALYGDIVMHDFADSYSNLTLKTMSGLRWAVKHCGHSRFFLKTDDDMWVNVPALLNTVNKEQATLQTALGGSCRVTGTKPHRNVKSKWYASYNAYPQPTYPGFCSGTGYVSSLNLARHVISVSPDVPFFHLEDVSSVEHFMHSVEKEHVLYGDIVMHDFADSFRNLTLKTMSGLRWAVKHCGHARFFLKTDDDMWVNVPALLNIVNEEQANLNTALGGVCRITGPEPNRSNKSRYFTPYNAYPQPTYPGFCSGTGYVSSLNLARHVISVSPDVPFFHLEDVYLSLCIQRLGKPFRLKRLKGFVQVKSDKCRLKSNSTTTAHRVYPPRLRKIWAASCNESHEHTTLIRQGAAIQTTVTVETQKGP
nr:hypothetical protein BaRGS_030742 [Batillaria attramentaria]